MTGSASRTQTRQHLLDVGRTLILQRGYGGVGLKELLDESGVPKGSFYHYFESKEAFGVTLLDTYFAEYETRLQAHFAQPTSALDRLMRFWQAWLDHVDAGGIAHRCLVVKLAAEIADLSDPMREVVHAGTTRLIEQVAAVITEGQRDGSVNAAVPALPLSRTLYGQWIGAAILAKVSRTPTALHDALSVTRHMLTPQGGTP